MIEISLKIDDKLHQELQSKLRNIPSGAAKAIARGINRALEGARTDAVRVICETYQIKPTQVRKTIKIIRARPNNLEGRVLSIGGPIPLINFRVLPRKPPNQKGKAPEKRKRVIAGVMFGNTQTLPYSFVARMKNGHVGVFSREDKSSLPIKQRFGPAIPQMLGREEVLNFIEKKAKERLDKEISHQIEYILGGGK